MLDRIEVALLQHEVEETLVYDVMEAGYWANEVLQARVSYEERMELFCILQRVKYLQTLYLENVLNQRANTLSSELQEMISPEAWRVFLRLDEVRGMELEYFQGNCFHPDQNLELVCSEQDLRSRLSSLKLKTY
jgi:hypothetical protein